MAYVGTAGLEWTPCDTATKVKHNLQVQQLQTAHIAQEETLIDVSKPVGTATTADGSVDFRGRPADKLKSGCWKTSPFIFGAALFEAVVNLGIATNLNVYFLGPMHLHPMVAATTLSNYWGTSYITSLIGGFLADAYLGNYWTIVIAMLIEIVGVALLIISSAVPPMKPECIVIKHNACPPVTRTQMGVCIFSLYLIALGAGCIRPCLSAFAGDQFDQENVKERKQTPSFFNWLVFSMSCGGILATTVVVHVGENVSWTWSFITVGIAMLMATLFMLAGTRLYRHQKPEGSPLTRIVQVFVAAFKNRKLSLPEDPSGLHEIIDSKSVMPKESGEKPYYLLRHTKGLRFLDKASITEESIVSVAETASPWRLCTVTQVEEVKGLIRCMPIAMSTLFLYMVLAQTQTWSIQQGYTMQRSIGKHYLFPPASLSAIAIAIVLLEVAVYDFLFVPFIRPYTGCHHGLTHLQRIGIGLALSIVAMAYAALLESIRLDMAKTHHFVQQDIVPLSIFYQLPLLVFLGTAVLFSHSGLFEFFYYESPVRMRSLGTALSMLPIAMGLYQNGGFMGSIDSITKKYFGTGWLTSTNLNECHLNYYYLLLAILSLINFGVYLLTVRGYKYKEFINIATVSHKLQSIRTPDQTLIPDHPAQPQHIPRPLHSHHSHAV